MFLDFMYDRGGTSGKRVPEGFVDKVCVLIYPLGSFWMVYHLKTGLRSMFQEFLESRGGGTPDKRVPEGFGDKACVLIFSP